MERQYETVIIVTPVLSEEDLKKAVKKYLDFLKSNQTTFIDQESWGLKQLAYPIQKKTTGYYFVFEYMANPEFISKLELELSRDESIMRFLTTKLDRYAIEYNDKKRKGLIGSKARKDKEQEQQKEEVVDGTKE